MNEQTKGPTLTGLAYFGKMMAAISHEIKNSLAIINENAGLMDDLSLMAKKGHVLDPERIGSISRRVIMQIQRADTIVKKMNRLAHSVDDPVKQIDVAASLGFTVELGEKILSSLGIGIEVLPLEAPLSINTNEFQFMNLLWEVMAHTAGQIDRGKTITITIHKRAGEIEFIFSPVNLSGDKEKPIEPGLLAPLGASTLTLADTQALVLILPESGKTL